MTHLQHNKYKSIYTTRIPSKYFSSLAYSGSGFFILMESAAILTEDVTEPNSLLLPEVSVTKEENSWRRGGEGRGGVEWDGRRQKR